jgi:hypothetical protein
MTPVSIITLPIARRPASVYRVIFQVEPSGVVAGKEIGVAANIT